MTEFLIKKFVNNYAQTEDAKVRENYGLLSSLTEMCIRDSSSACGCLVKRTQRRFGSFAHLVFQGLRLQNPDLLTKLKQPA